MSLFQLFLLWLVPFKRVEQTVVSEGHIRSISRCCTTCSLFMQNKVRILSLRLTNGNFSS